MKKSFFLFIILIAIGSLIPVKDLWAQSQCEKSLIAAENLYQSGQLYDVPEKLAPCLESGFNFQEKQNAYRLITLTYLNINQEEKAKETMHKLLRLNPDYTVTKGVDPVELFNLYQQFNVEPVFYTGLRVGAVATLPLTLMERSSSSLAGKADKFYAPFYGFNVGGDFALPLLKRLLVEFNPSYANSTYQFQSFFLTDGFSESSPLPQVQEVTGRESFHSINFPLSLNLRLPSKSPRLKYNMVAGVGASFLLSSSFKDVNRINRQIFTEEINMSRIETTQHRRMANISAHMEVGMEYKYLGFFWGGRVGFSSAFLNYTQYSSQEEMFLNPMSTNFGWLDDDFVLSNGYFSVFVRKPLYKFL